MKEDFPYNPDLYAVIREALLSVWKGKRVEALLQALTEDTQEIEDLILDVKSALDFRYATGSVLDIWGAIFDEPRGELSNDHYRRVIVAKVVSLKARGSFSDIKTVAEEVTDRDIEVYPQFPAGYSVVIEAGEPLSDATRTRSKRMIGIISPAGVGSQMIEGPSPVFRFDEPSLDTRGLARIV